MVRAFWILLYALCSLGALYFADYALVKRGAPALRRLYGLSRLPDLQLGGRATTPGRLRGTLHTASDRHAPSGRACALWYGWIEETRQSGRSSYRVTVCARGEDEDLQLRQGGRAAKLGLFDRDEQIALLKGGTLESLPPNRVALDLGEVSSTTRIPPRMQRLCSSALPRSGPLHYREACAPPAAPVTVLGCVADEGVQSCGSPPGAISLRELRPILRAYANDSLDVVRGAAACVGVALSLLAAALFKLRRPRAEAP
jgi:hypothetical protein